MLFNSFDFGFFLVIVYILYWGLGTSRRKSQNVVLLLASYFFYGIWDWRFLGLLMASSLIDYIVGIYISRANTKPTKKAWLVFSILWNLGILVAFKYFNFFLDSFNDLFELGASGGSFTIWTAIIPLGLSFYTFQTMSYSIDVYKGTTRPTKNLLEFLCFVSFFPQLVAGPIERASQLLPQFHSKRNFSIQESKEGLRQILWGLFKKVLVADKLGIAVTMVFHNPDEYGVLMLVFASLLFFFQVYCDFSGYTDIAIGTARLFGFTLSKNFNLPYLSKSITDFWQRWHITLTKWFTDYVYVPFVKSAQKTTLFWNATGLMLTMVLVGLWHGANWTFVAFGFFNGLILIVERIPLGRNKTPFKKIICYAPRVINLFYFFTIAMVASIFFRATTIDHALTILKRIFTLEIDSHISTLIGWKLIYLVLLILAELWTQKKDYPLQHIEKCLPQPVRWVLYYGMIFLLVRYAETQEAFIYFQF